MNPFLKVGHRNDHVFLRLVRGRTSSMVRLTPAEAAEIGKDLLNLADRASGRKYAKPSLKLTRNGAR